MAYQTSYRDFGATFPKAASTAFNVGEFVIFDGAGAIIPATGGTGGIVGITNEEITSASPNYAVVAPLNVTSANDVVSFTAAVTAGGPALAAAVGQTINIDAADASGLDYATIGAGTDFTVVAFIDASTLVVKAL